MRVSLLMCFFANINNPLEDMAVEEGQRLVHDLNIVSLPQTANEIDLKKTRLPI